METEAILCSQCAAPLQVPNGEAYVTCSFCHANLAIKKNESLVYTEKLEQIHQTTQELTRKVAAIQQENQLEKLEEQWMQERKKHLIRSRTGELQEPSAMQSMIVGVLGGGFGIVWTIFAYHMTRAVPFTKNSAFGILEWVFPAFGILFTMVLISVAFVHWKKVKSYQLAQERYQKARQELQK